MVASVCHARSKGVFAAAVACLFLLCGCHQTRYSWVLNGVDVTLPEMTGKERPQNRAGMPAELLPIRAGGGKTVLITSLIKDNPEKTDDEWAQTFVCVIDGAPVVGQRYAVEPTNCRLILNEVFRPCRQPYQGVEGELTVKSLEGGKVKAEVVFRNVITWARADSYIIRETMTFEPVATDDIRLRQAGIRCEGATAGARP